LVSRSVASSGTVHSSTASQTEKGFFSYPCFLPQRYHFWRSFAIFGDSYRIKGLSNSHIFSFRVLSWCSRLTFFFILNVQDWIFSSFWMLCFGFFQKMSVSYCQKKVVSVNADGTLVIEDSSMKLLPCNMYGHEHMFQFIKALPSDHIPQYLEVMKNFSLEAVSWKKCSK